MGQYTIKLARNGREYTLQIEAPDQATAQQAAIEEISGPKYMSDDERRQKIAALDAELASVRGQESDVVEEVVKPTAAAAVGGAARSVLGIAEAVSDVGAALGSSKMQSASEWLQEKQRAVERETIGFTRDAFEQSFGRPLTKEEEKEITAGVREDLDTGELGADIALGIGGAGLLRGAKTVKGALTLGALDGGVSTFLLSDSEASDAAARTYGRLKDASVGAVFGGLLNGAVVGIPAGLKNFYGYRINKAIKQAGGMEEFAKMQESAGGRMSVGMFTGDPAMLRAEREAAAKIGQDNLSALKESVIRNIAKSHGIDLPDTGKLGEGLSKHVEVFTRSLGKGVSEARKATNQAFRNRLDGASKLWSGPIYKPTNQGYVDEVSRIFKEISGSKSKLLTDEAKSLMEQIIKAPDDGFSAKGLNKILVDLNEILGAKGDGFFRTAGRSADSKEQINRLGNAYAAQLKQAINQSIDQANPVTREAAEALSEVQKARKFYGRRMNNIATMEQEVLTSLGVHGKNAREVFGRVLSADPQQVRAANRLISRLQDGDTILSKMREGMIHFSAAQSVSNQAKATGKMTGDFNLADFLNNYATNSVRAVELGIMTPKQRELGQAGVKLARKILNSDQVEYGVFQTHNPLSLSNVLINAASRDPGFLSRMLGMVIEKGQGADWLFHSPQGIKTLTTLSDVVVGGKSSPAAQAAANSATLALLDIVGTTTVMESLNREEVEQEQ